MAMRGLSTVICLGLLWPVGGLNAADGPARTSTAAHGEGSHAGASGAMRSVQAAPTDDSLWASIDAAVEATLVEQQIVGLSLAVVENGVTLYLQGYGLEDREKGIPVSPTETLFRWASVSKTLTGVAAAQLADAGILDLDAPVPDLYPAYALPSRYISGGSGGYPPEDLELSPLPDGTTLTLRQVLGHLAGIQHYDNGLSQPSPPPFRSGNPAINTGFEWALPRWEWAPLVALPGQRYSYSSPGFNLAGAVIGAVYADAFGLSMTPDDAYTALVQEAIVAQAGATGLQPDYQWEAIDHRAVGYVVQGEADVVRDTNTDVSWKLPAGGYLSTAEAAGRYCEGLAGDALLSASGKALAWTAQHTASGSSTGYGLGFGIGSRNGHKRVSHNGEQEKATSRLVLYPDDGLCVVVLTNTRSGGEQASIDLAGLTNTVEDLVRAAP